MYDISTYIIHNIIYDIRHYLSFAAVLDASIAVQELCLSSLNQRLDRFPASKRIQYVSPIQFGLWTLTHWAVVGTAHSGGSNLQSVHAEQVPKTPPLPHLPICKAKMFVHRAKLVDLCNHNVHATVVEVQPPVPLPLNVVVCHCSRLQYGK